MSVSNERSDSPMGLFRIEIIYGLSQKALELDRCKRMAALVIRHMSGFCDGWYFHILDGYLRNHQGRREFSINFQTFCMLSLLAETCIHLCFQTEIIATEKKKDSLPTIGHNVSPGARYILRGFSMSAFFRNRLSGYLCPSESNHPPDENSNRPRSRLSWNV